MRISKKSLRVFTAIVASLGLACTGLAQARSPLDPGLIVDTCQGRAQVVSQSQSDTRIDLEFEVSVNCEGVCIGSLEYTLVLTDGDDRELVWHLTHNWDWQRLDGPFTVQLQRTTPPGVQLQEVRAVQIGRCSCAP